MELELADSTIKLLRLLANLCIEEGVGEKIADNSDIMEVLKFSFFLHLNRQLGIFKVNLISYFSIFSFVLSSLCSMITLNGVALTFRSSI